MPPDANRMQPDHLPTPFSAADIRAGCPLGRTIRLQSEAPGGDLTFRRIRFVEVDADGAVQEFQAINAEGRPIGEPTLRRSSWLDLQHHASQPATGTVIDEVDLALPFGTEACWRYTVRTRERVCHLLVRQRPGGDARSGRGARGRRACQPVDRDRR